MIFSVVIDKMYGGIKKNIYNFLHLPPTPQVTDVYSIYFVIIINI